MTTKSSYPFYKSIRFRFGLLFNCLLLLFLLAIIFLLYGNIKNELEKNFLLRLSGGATAVLQKTEVNPTTIPLPQKDEYFLLTYNYGRQTDTLFNNLPPNSVQKTNDSTYRSRDWWSISTTKQFETGGVIRVVYALPSNEYKASIQQLQTLLFLYIPIAILISFVAGYFLSGILLRPLHNIITKASRIDLTNDIQLLDEPVINDELHELVDALNRMLSRIEKQSGHQNAFFASASHELRTPLSNMLTELQTVNLNQASPAMRTLVQNQMAEVQRLKKLVNNFLLMSQLKADALTLNKSSFSLADLSLDVMNQLQAQAKQKDQTFKIEMLPDSGNFMVVADASHVAIILKNLVENALKYGLPNSIITFCLCENTDGVQVTIQNKTDAVINNISQLKNDFARAEKFGEGFGLGLWITDQLAERNGATLRLSSAGNTFFAELIIPS